VLPANAKHPDATMHADVASSKAGQEPSTHSRLDLRAHRLRPEPVQRILAGCCKDWTSNVVVGSLMHGVVARSRMGNLDRQLQSACSRLIRPRQLISRLPWWPHASPTAPARNNVSEMSKRMGGSYEPPILNHEANQDLSLKFRHEFGHFLTDRDSVLL